jgi:excisionase family DNA binding protein
MKFDDNSNYKADLKGYSEVGLGEVENSTKLIFDNLIWMTTKEAAFYLRKTSNAIRLLVFKGDLKARKYKRRLYFKKDELDTLLETAFITGGN